MLDFRVIGICRSKLKKLNHAKIVINCSVFLVVAKRAYWGSPSNEKAPSVGIMASGFPKPSPGDLNKETFIMCHGHIYMIIYRLIKAVYVFAPCVSQSIRSALLGTVRSRLQERRSKKAPRHPRNRKWFISPI